MWLLKVKQLRSNKQNNGLSLEVAAPEGIVAILSNGQGGAVPCAYFLGAGRKALDDNGRMDFGIAAYTDATVLIDSPAQTLAVLQDGKSMVVTGRNGPHAF